MRRRRFVVGLGSGAAAWPLAGTAQQPATSVRQIGVLDMGDAPAPIASNPFLKGLREGGGYIVGQNCVIHYRGADWKLERLAGLATELVSLKPDVIFAPTTATGRAARQATTIIPIVVANMIDPVGDGFVASLARPGGNVTGLTNIAGDLAAKRLALLKELVPSATRIAVLWHRGSASDRMAQSVLSEMERAARGLQVQLRPTELSAPDDLDRVFASMDGQVDACMTVLTQALIGSPHDRIIELAARHRLPAMLPVRAHVKDGALISYAPDEPDLFRRAGTYVARVLNGARPGDLPVEQPTKFELSINLKTAKALGLDVPPSLLARADEVIE